MYRHTQIYVLSGLEKMYLLSTLLKNFGFVTGNHITHNAIVDC